MNTTEHIHAHMMICFIALTMMRLIQLRIAAQEPANGASRDGGGDLKWFCGMSGRVVTAVDLAKYGRSPIDFYKIDDEDYVMDFSTAKE